MHKNGKTCSFKDNEWPDCYWNYGRYILKPILDINVELSFPLSK